MSESFSEWKFSAEIKAPAEALDWLERQLSEAAEDGFPWCTFSRASFDTLEVWTEEDEDGDPFELSATIAEMQKLFNIAEPWYVTWAVVDDHFRPVSDHYRGGAAVCHKGEVTEIDTLEWALDLVKKLQGAETETHSDTHSTPSQ